MKPSNIPTGWQEVELGTITECLDGKRIPITEGDRKGGDVPYYGANGQVGLIDKPIFNEELLLIAEDGGSWGKGQKCSYIINGEAWVNNHAHVLRIIKSKAEIKFLMYWLNNSDLNKYISGTTRGKLNQKIMNRIKILLPPLPTQQKIVQILEKTEKLKQKREEADKLTNEYLKSVFNEMFYNKGFEEVELGEVCEINPKKSELENVDKGLEVSFVPMAVVQEHEVSFIPKETKKLDEVYTGYTYFKNGDVLLAKVTPCFENGKSGIAKNLKNGIGFGSSEYHVIRPSKRLLAELIYFIISDNSFLTSGKKQMSGTGGLKRLPKDYIYHKIVPLPPLPLQQKFASLVEKVEKLKEKQKESKEKINEMFDALMQKAFRGEL